MKTYWEIREEYLIEGKISMAKLKKGDKVQLRFKGRDAKIQGYKKGENPYGEGNKLQILGFGTLKRGSPATARNAIFDSIADFKTKWKKELLANIQDHPSPEEASAWQRSLWDYNATEKLDKNLDRLIYQSSKGGTSTGKKLKADRGWPVFVYKILGGSNKGKISYLHFNHNGYWAKYWDTDTEFWLES
jgi:hypothetical protein